MPGDDQVRRWLASFKGAIADADYVDAFMDSGYDSLENMIFSADDLMDGIEQMKQGHANRIARDAAAMLENIGNIITGAVTATYYTLYSFNPCVLPIHKLFYYNNTFIDRITLNQLVYQMKHSDFLAVNFNSHPNRRREGNTVRNGRVDFLWRTDRW